MNEPSTPQWREDFPVKWENDHYITRRELAKFLTLGSGILAAASVLIAGIGLRAKRALVQPRLLIGSATAIASTGSLLFRYPSDQEPCIAVSTADGTVRAYSQICTHLSCAVVHRADRHDLFCPCHGGCFSAEDGRPTAGPPTRPLPRIRLEVIQDDVYAVGRELG